MIPVAIAALHAPAMAPVQDTALAQQLLQSVPGWDATAIAAALRKETPHRVNLPAPVPVHIIYATAVTREDRTPAAFARALPVIATRC